MSVYIDTSALLAVLNASDHFHGRAKHCWETLLEQEAHMICNNYVLIETFALLQNRFGMEAVRLFQSAVMPALVIAWVDREIHERSASAMSAANRRDLSLVDCSSFETMRQLGLQQAFTFDRHFGELGFEILP